MKEYILRLSRDMDIEIEQKMLQHHILISWHDSLLPDTVFIKTNMDQDELEKLDFIQKVEFPRVFKVNI